MKEVLGERPDIARLYEVQLERAPFFLEMEYTAGGSLAFHMMGALVEFERSLIAERTKAGMRVLLSPSLGPAVAVRENYGRP